MSDMKLRCVVLRKDAITNEVRPWPTLDGSSESTPLLFDSYDDAKKFILQIINTNIFDSARYTWYGNEIESS